MRTEQIDTRIEKAATYCSGSVEALRSYPVQIAADKLLVGFTEPLNGTLSPGSDNIHFPMNVESLMTHGFSGIARQARTNASRLAGEAQNYLQCIATCYDAVLDFVERHASRAAEMAADGDGERRVRLEAVAENCRALTTRAPESFHEAVQLFWFAWNIRGLGTIGRLDQHLCPFYRADIASGKITYDRAFSILTDLWDGFNISGTGDTLRNIMLAGQDREGNDATNELSYLMIDVGMAVRKPEPHLNVRLHSRTPKAFLQKVAELHTLGHGQGTVYNDEVLIPALVEKQVPLASARNYANNGCTEVTIDGESGIVFTMVECVKSLELMLFNGREAQRAGPAVGHYSSRHTKERALATSLQLGYQTGDFARMTRFEEVYDAFLNQYLHQVDLKLEALGDMVRRAEEQAVSSLFMAGTFPETIARGVDPLRGGFTIPCHMVFSGAIATAADGLAAIKRVVFEDAFCTPAQLLEALQVDFEGHDPLRWRCLAAPKFGNDDDFVDLIAADIACKFCERVVGHKRSNDKPIWPALFCHLFNDYAKIVGATPDGRQWGDPIAENFSPTPGRALKGPTAVIRSVSKGPLAEACGTSIFHLSLSRNMIAPDATGAQMVLALLEGALKQNVAVMNIAVYDVAQMRDAQRHPERHQDMIVRVWGFCGRFVDLSDDMQEHIIQRTLAGVS